MKPARQSMAEDYRRRAARLRRRAQDASCAELREVLLRLASKYDEVADGGCDFAGDDDAVVVLPRVRCRFHHGIAVLYYLD